MAIENTTLETTGTITEQAARRMMSTLRHSHQLAILKGVLVSIAILVVGVFTMAMPALGPASGAAMDVVAEGRAKSVLDLDSP